MKYVVLILWTLCTFSASGQRAVNIKVVSIQSPAPLDARIRVNHKPLEVAQTPDGYFQVVVNPPDTIIIDADTYPIKEIFVPQDDSVIVVLDKDSHDANAVFSRVDETAAFPGGIEKFYQYVGKSMRYPQQAKKQKADGRVFVEFVVNADGSINRKDIHIVSGIHPACDQEAVRVVQESQPWRPGKIKGRPVRQRLVLPFVFHYR